MSEKIANKLNKGEKTLGILNNNASSVKDDFKVP